MEQYYGEEPPVKIEPVDLDYCQDDMIGSLEETEPAAFVHESQPILAPEMGNGDVEDATDNDKQIAVRKTLKRKGGPKKKNSEKWTKFKKKVTTTQRKPDRDLGDNQKLVESTSKSEASSYHSPSMLEEPQDVIIKPEQDNPGHPSVDLPCPPTLQYFTENQISSAFEKCGAASRKSKLKFTDSDSLFGEVYTILTNKKKSCLYERQYLHRFWLHKYKPESLRNCSEEQIGTAFLLCYNKQLKLNYNFPNSLFHKVYTFLTEAKDSSLTERRYLFDLWTIKFKDALQQPESGQDPSFKKYSLKRRRKMVRRLRAQKKDDLLQQQAMITQSEEDHPSLELETTFQTDRDFEDEESPSHFSQIPEEQKGKRIRIRVKVEVEADNHYDASDAENNDDSSVVNDVSYDMASPPMSPYIPVSDDPDPISQPQQKPNEDTDPKLTSKPVIRLTRLSVKKLQQEKMEGSSEIRGQRGKASADRKSRKTVKSVKYKENSSDDDSNVNYDDNDDYAVPEPDHNSSDNENSDSAMNIRTPAQRKRAIISSRGSTARAIKRARGRPRTRPIKVKKPRLNIHNAVFRKLINFQHWGKWKNHYKGLNQLTIPVKLWQESHGKHAEFIVSNTCEDLEDMEKTKPTAGKGTFANPHWTYSDEGNENGISRGPLKCVCPACGLTFLEIDELLQHRDETHTEYLAMCVVCSKPMAGKDNMAPHLGSHFSKDQLEEFLEEEMTTLGAPPEGCAYRLYKCQKCCKIFVGTKSFRYHTNTVHLKKFRSMENREKTECKVCGMPLITEYMSFHLRTHFNLEEEKEYFREQQSKLKKNIVVENNILGKDRTEVRINQLKNLLEALQRRNGKTVTKWPKPNLAKEAPVRERVNTKRDGNYGPVQCETCGKVICTIYSLRIHEMSVHGLEKTFECTICHRPFGTKKIMSSHIPTHFNLDEQEKYSVWTGNVWEFLERLNNGEDLSKPPSSARGKKLIMKGRKIRKKIGRPRKHHHLYENKNGIGGGSGGQGQSQPDFYEGATVSMSARNLEEDAPEEGGSTSTFNSAAELSSMSQWNAAYGQGQRQDGLGYFEPQIN